MSCMIFWPSRMLILPQHPWWYPWTQKLFIPYRARKSIVPAETKRNLLVWTPSNPLLMFNANWLKNHVRTQPEQIKKVIWMTRAESELLYNMRSLQGTWFKSHRVLRLRHDLMWNQKREPAVAPVSSSMFCSSVLASGKQCFCVS